MKDFTTSIGGARVVINPAPFRIVANLKRTLLKEVKENSIGLKITGSKNENFFEKDLDFTGCLDFIKNAIIGIDTSEETTKAIFDCLSYCTYQTTNKIDEALFDNKPEAREDYYEIVFACIEENLRPFIKSLVSKWSALAPKLGENQALIALLQSMTK